MNRWMDGWSVAHVCADQMGLAAVVPRLLFGRAMSVGWLE